MTVHTGTSRYTERTHERPVLIWSLTAVVIVGMVLALVGMILNAWLLLGLAAAAAALATFALWPAGVMSHVTVARSTTRSATGPPTDRGP